MEEWCQSVCELILKKSTKSLNNYCKPLKLSSPTNTFCGKLFRHLETTAVLLSIMVHFSFFFAMFLTTVYWLTAKYISTYILVSFFFEMCFTNKKEMKTFHAFLLIACYVLLLLYTTLAFSLVFGFIKKGE